MGRFFQDLYYPHFDYSLAGCDRLPGWEFRGPLPDLAKPYFVVGAAQVFGRFCKEPIPQLLFQAIGLPVLNLAISGSGPSMFRESAFFDVINGAEIALVQVMSGRSESNSEFDNSSSGGARGVRMSDSRKMFFDELFAEKLSTSGRGDVVRIADFLDRPAVEDGAAVIAVARLLPPPAAENADELCALFARAVDDLSKYSE